MATEMYVEAVQTFIHYEIKMMRKGVHMFIVIYRYYEASIKGLLQSLDVPIDQLHFVMGSHYQLARYDRFDYGRVEDTVISS